MTAETERAAAADVERERSTLGRYVPGKPTLPAADVELIDGFSRYQETRGFSPNTIRRRRVSVGKFSAHMAPGGIAAARADDVDEWLHSYGSATTRHAFRSDLAALYRWAARRALVERNPMDQVDPVKVKRSLPRPAPAEAIARAFMLGDGDLQVMILLGSLAGLRRSEIAALDRVNVHLDSEPPVIHVVDGKGGRDRIVPIHPALLEQLRRQTCWLYRPRSKPLSAHSVGERLARALSEPGGQRITAHQLRHSFGTEAARWSGGDVVLVGSLMGHSEPKTTMGYIKWSPEAGADIVARITPPNPLDELGERRKRRSA